MYIKYNEYELIELFEKEPIPVFGQEEGVFIYSNVDECGVKIVMTMSVYENTCNINLSHADTNDRLIFEYNVPGVKQLECTKDLLRIIKNKEPSVTIYFKPNYAITID